MPNALNAPYPAQMMSTIFTPLLDDIHKLKKGSEIIAALELKSSFIMR